MNTESKIDVLAVMPATHRTNWRTMTRAEIAANPLAYHRSRYAEEKRAWPQYAKLECSEYGWLLKLANRNPRPLRTLKLAEAQASMLAMAKSCVVATNEAVAAWREVLA